MQNPVVIKGNKAGMTVYLDPALPFTELLEAVKKKFRETARFWGSAQMTLTLEGRRLSPEEEFSVVNAITENSGIEILCLIDADAERIRRCEKALNEKLMELSASTGQFYKGNLRNGDVLESEASIVVIGDVDCGARVSAKGNIIILGTLKGNGPGGPVWKQECRGGGHGDGALPGKDLGSCVPEGRKGAAPGLGPHDDSCQKWADLFGTHKKELFKCTKFHLKFG